MVCDCKSEAHPLESGVHVRPYEERDRPIVRQICGDTADRGEPVENFFPDRELVADLVTRYYTDFDSQSSWVIEDNGRVVGYLTGCLDTRRSRRTLLWRIAPVAVLRAVFRGLLFRKQVWRILKRSPPRPDLSQYPAHVHVNVAREFRGRHAGRELMEKFFTQARAAGVTGIHANVRRDNERGRHFFEEMGFEPIIEDGYTVVYGKKP